MTSDVARVIPGGVLKAASRAVMVVGALLVAAQVLGASRGAIDGPLGPRLSSGILFAVTVLAFPTAWNLRSPGRTTDTRSVTAHLITSAGLVVMLVVAGANIIGTDPMAGRLSMSVGLLVFAAGLLMVWRAGKRPPRVYAPIVTQTVRTHAGERWVRIGQPQQSGDRWTTMWSVGAASGTIVRVSYGPDSMSSLTAALADAEAATVVL
ncbi:hypothetical protein GCM10027289_16560 [Tsukamurella serpentis]